MREAVKALGKYIDTVSKRVQELSQKLDEATINRDVAKLKKLLKDAEDMLDGENSASQASIYYFIGTAYSDFAELADVSGDESIKKQLFCPVLYEKTDFASKRRKKKNPADRKVAGFFDGGSGGIRTHETLPST